jgi:hypothetical protein
VRANRNRKQEFNTMANADTVEQQMIAAHKQGIAAWRQMQNENLAARGYAKGLYETQYEIEAFTAGYLGEKRRSLVRA